MDMLFFNFIICIAIINIYVFWNTYIKMNIKKVTLLLFENLCPPTIQITEILLELIFTNMEYLNWILAGTRSLNLMADIFWLNEDYNTAMGKKVETNSVLSHWKHQWLVLPKIRHNPLTTQKRPSRYYSHLNRRHKSLPLASIDKGRSSRWRMRRMQRTSHFILSCLEWYNTRRS